MAQPLDPVEQLLPLVVRHQLVVEARLRLGEYPRHPLLFSALR